MASPFAISMVAKLETMLAANAGVKSVSVDGQSVTYGELLEQYEYWRRRVAREDHKAPTVSTIRMGRF